MVSNFRRLCPSALSYVCQKITSESLDKGRDNAREYMSRSHMKVIGSRSKSRKKLMVQKSPFLQCKAVVSNNYGSIKHRFMMFGECPCDGGL